MQSLHLTDAVAELLTDVLARALDDLEARALVAEHHDPVLGPPSAAAYRRDLTTLVTLLDRLTPAALATPVPQPEHVALRWIDDRAYTIVDRRPVLLTPDTHRPDVDHCHGDEQHRPQQADIDRNADGMLLPIVASVPRHAAEAVHTQQPAHRLAPRCDAAARRASHERGGGSC